MVDCNSTKLFHMYEDEGLIENFLTKPRTDSKSGFKWVKLRLFHHPPQGKKNMIELINIDLEFEV